MFDCTASSYSYQAKVSAQPRLTAENAENVDQRKLHAWLIPLCDLCDLSGKKPNDVALGTGSELVVLVFEQDVERGKRSVTTRDVLLQVELVGIA
jgi:hypothetical protein